jgi:uncharacterized membrane protein YgcG
MAKLGAFSVWRHGVVAASVVASSALVLLGIVGSRPYPERFDAKQVVVQPAGDDGVRIREVVDQDFGSNDRHGYERVIPNDFGVPTDIVASSPDAPDDLHVFQAGGETVIRIGDPDVTVSGQHRYVLEYTLPDAQLTSGMLFLDIIGDEETLETERFEVIVTGMTLREPGCSVGAFGTEGGCTLEPAGDVYRTVISPLRPGQALTISGEVTGRVPPAEVPIPPIPERRAEENRLPLAALVLPLGALSAGTVYVLARRYGRNEVYAGGAADAAFGGPLPPPGSPPPPVRLVPDTEMDELATTEFEPPRGLAPWQGNVLLRERIDETTVNAWFSGHAARDVLTITRDGDKVVLGRGPRFDEADPADLAVLRPLFQRSDTITLGGYDKAFATAWNAARKLMQQSIARSGWWKRMPPAASAGGCSTPVALFATVWVLVAFGSVVTALVGVFRGPVGAVLFGLLVPAFAAFAMYRSLLPARSATGSALALRTESFRRFLAASEGRHVEWAWRHGVLREYSAWAVALGAADTWQRAMEASSVPPTEMSSGPIVVWAMAPSLARAHTPPTSSGRGGGSFGGFSGSAGGGGGGGRSGSW